MPSRVYISSSTWTVTPGPTTISHQRQPSFRRPAAGHRSASMQNYTIYHTKIALNYTCMIWTAGFTRYYLATMYQSLPISIALAAPSPLRPPVAGQAVPARAVR